jgi:hypothetical protein
MHQASPTPNKLDASIHWLGAPKLGDSLKFLLAKYSKLISKLIRKTANLDKL